VPTIDELENLDADDDFEGDVGSWFHNYTTDGDMFEVGEAIVEEVLQEPYKYFQGEDDSDEDDELDEEDDDDEGSVDLEDDEDDQPAKKKQKK